MIFEYFKIVRTQDDIWNEIKSMRPGSLTQFYACTHDVIRYAIKMGFVQRDTKQKKAHAEMFWKNWIKKKSPLFCW